ncbi:hypothetical protein ABPG72_004489 [Tetrahymena utriculariae]
MQDFHASLVASLASVIIFAPFDVARTKLNLNNQPLPQLLSSIYKTEGLKGFYRGLAMSSATTPLSISLYLFLYSKAKNFTKSHCENNILSNTVASVATGVVCNTITNPLWLLKTRIQATNKGLFQNASEIYNKDGFRGYYRGLGTSFLGLIHLAVYFPLYEILKDTLNSQYQDSITQNILIASSVSKLISLIVSYPNTVLMTKIQNGMENISLFSLVQQTYQKQGLSGLFSGIKVEVGRSLPANALTFMLYESLKQKHILRIA